MDEESASSGDGGEWGDSEKALFKEGMYRFGRDLRSVQRQSLPRRSMGEVLSYYYKWKSSREYRAWRRQHKMKQVLSMIPDWHNDVCEICDEGGDLICCDTCNLCYHGSCLDPPLESVPKLWLCPECSAALTAPEEISKAVSYVKGEYARLDELRRSFVSIVLGDEASAEDVALAMDCEAYAPPDAASPRKRRRSLGLSEDEKAGENATKKRRGREEGKENAGADNAIGGAAASSKALYHAGGGLGEDEGDAWSIRELLAFVRGIEALGAGKWKEIKDGAGEELRRRSVEDIAGKWVAMGGPSWGDEDAERRARFGLGDGAAEAEDGLDEKRVEALPRGVRDEFYSICWGRFHQQWWPCCVLDPRDATGELRKMARDALGRAHLVVWTGSHDFSLLRYKDLQPFRPNSHQKPPRLGATGRALWQRAVKEAVEQQGVRPQGRMHFLFREMT